MSETTKDIRPVVSKQNSEEILYLYGFTLTYRFCQDAWDAESEEENSQKEAEEKVVRVKKKKTLAQKIAEKEEAAEKAAEERLKREEEEKQLNTPEGGTRTLVS